MEKSLPEGRRIKVLVAHGEQLMQRIQVLQEGEQVIAQSEQHLVIAMLQAVLEEVLTEHFQDRILRQA